MHSALPDELGDVERVVGAAGARVDAEQEFVEPGQHEGGGGGGAGGVQEAGLGHQRRLQDLQRGQPSFGLVMITYRVAHLLADWVQLT